jgi:pimeloyl-ACP methyl ester carboxylesterase
MNLHTREWGRGETLIALHPLALESSAFEGVATVLAEGGVRTIAVDLPGFGRTPATEGPPHPAALAEPVIELARSLDTPPTLLGISLGGRVALECALRAPEAFRSSILVSPYLPWKRARWMLASARYLDPALVEKLPIDAFWPVLHWLTRGIERIPRVRDDAITRAGVRMVYYASCPATRTNIVAVARELALEPAFGPRGLWTRLPDLRCPSAFVWGEKDQLVSYRFAPHVARALPDARHLVLECCGHAPYRAHDPCLVNTVEVAIRELQARSDAAGARRRSPSQTHSPFAFAPCVVA